MPPPFEPVVEHKALQLAFAAQPLDGRTHLLVAPFGEVAVADVADAVGHPSGVGHARDGDPLAADRDALARAVEVFDRHLHRRARLALEPLGDLFGREAPGILAVDGDDLVADLEPGLVGRGVLIGLCNAHVVLLLADERADAAVLARREELEILHPLLGNVLRIGVEVLDHAAGGPLHQVVGVDLVDILQREGPHHVDRDLHVASQPEVVACGEEREGGRRNERAADGGSLDLTFHCVFSFAGTSPAGTARGPRRGGCRPARSIVRTAKP